MCLVRRRNDGPEVLVRCGNRDSIGFSVVKRGVSVVWAMSIGVPELVSPSSTNTTSSAALSF